VLQSASIFYSKTNMFGKKNTSSSSENPPSIDQNFGQDFIHTMKDDIDSLSSSPKNIPEQKNIDSSKENPSASPNTKNSSPFLSSSEETIAKKNGSEKDLVYSHIDYVPQRKSFLKKFFLFIVILFFVCAIGFGAYYFWKTNTYFNVNEESLPEEEEFSSENNQTENETSVIITPAAEKYSYEKPNYLQINIETSSPEEIQRTISSVTTELKSIQNNLPFEFIITDSNNNPIAFPIFSLAAKLNFSPDLLITLEEGFSFYIHNNQERSSAGIAIELKNELRAKEEMLKEEPLLNNILSTLFFSGFPITDTTDFQSNDYNGTTVKFFNFTSDASVTIDYAFYENRLIIADSKNTMHAIIDKITIEK